MKLIQSFKTQYLALLMKKEKPFDVSSQFYSAMTSFLNARHQHQINIKQLKYVWYLEYYV